jgi:hypothetical protein
MKDKISRNKISRHYKSFFELENMALAEDDHLMIDWGESLIEHFVNLEVERRIAERMPSEEDVEINLASFDEITNDWFDFTHAVYHWLRSCLTQKTEGEENG